MKDIDLKLVEELYCVKEYSIREISNEIGVCFNTLSKRMKEHGISIRSIGGGVKHDIPDKKHLYKMYITDCMSQRAIAKELDTTKSTVKRWLNFHKIPIRSKKQIDKLNSVETPSKKELSKLYLEKEKTISSIGEKYDVSPTTVANWLRFYDIQIKDFSERSTRHKKPTKKQLLKLYVDQNLTLSSIARMYDCTPATVKRWLVSYGIKVLNRQDTFIHKSDDVFLHVSKNSFNYYDYKLPSGKNIKVQGYEGCFLNMILKSYSKYEENDIVYEIKSIPKISYFLDGKERKYFPDFYIPKDNLIIEVKSLWTYKYDLKKNLLKKHYTKKSGYNFKFYIFDDSKNFYYCS